MFLDPAAEMARSDLSNRCTPLRDVVPNNSDLNIVNVIRTGESTRGLVSASGSVNFEYRSCLAASPTWISDLSLLAAMRLGGLERFHPWRPTRDSPRTGLNPSAELGDRLGAVRATG